MLSEPGKPLVVGVITYDHAHLKTEQLLARFTLMNKIGQGPQLELILLAIPFSPRPVRTVRLAHRPDQEKAPTIREMAKYYSLDVLPCSYDNIPDVADCYIVAGAGIFSPAAIGTKKIINAHPGIIPSARGLDAFKWSILDDVPLGVTLHYIDAEVDAGEVICIFDTPVFKSDTIETLARRHYELEIDVLSRFLAFTSSPSADVAKYPVRPSRMRMPAATEEKMLVNFSLYKKKFCSADHK